MQTIDRDARRKVSELIRKLSSGIIKGEDFVYYCCNDFNTKDKSVISISHLIWTVFDPDFKMNRNSVGKHALARTVLFLHTDLHYDWIDSGLKDALITFADAISFNLFAKHADRLKSPPYHRQGDCTIFPFKNQRDFNEARKLKIFGANT